MTGEQIMVSRRNFISICIMMAVLLFMLQFSQVIKENGSDYSVNEYMETEVPSGDKRWRADGAGDGTEEASGQGEEPGGVVFVGDAETDLGRVVLQWCDYTKRKRIVVSGLRELTGGETFRLLLLDSDAVDFENETQILTELAQKDIGIIFCNLPDSAVIAENSNLRGLLGISAVDRQVTVLGIQMYSGFLLGGEAVFQAQSKEDEKYQDLQLTVPWYRTAGGTKTYMVGMLKITENADQDDPNRITREDQPALIWRNSFQSAKIFAVNGSYLSDLTGLGILDAFVYEMEPYQIYPVINARNTVVANYPDFSSENAVQIRRLYSREPDALYRDVMWPGISAVSKRYDLKLTCCVTPQNSGGEDAAPDTKDVAFYLQQFREIGAEAGRSLEHSEEISLTEKLRRDEEFYGAWDARYRFGSCYLGDGLPEELDGLLEDGSLGDVRSLVVNGREDLPLVSYYTDDVTLQRITVDTVDYAYSMDLRMRSVVTALGYSNILMDMSDVTWPKSRADQWENYFDDISSNVGTYWSRFRQFDSTSLTESDARLRSFLNLSYTDACEGDTVTLYVENGGQEAWFLLRTHGEEIRRMEGGTYEKLEKDFYLLRVTSDQAKIQLGDEGKKQDIRPLGG